ncbi:MAG: acyltransferase family protein [Bacteroidales bacterium]|nr:acyltransferase family protein [Bacteroidales bacterium]
MVNNNIRRYDIDWLRILAMMTVFLFHCARFFNQEDWHVKNNELSDGMEVFIAVVSQWIMPLFFVLSASGIYYALFRRSNGVFIAERFKRLVIPLIFGILILVPPQVYVESVTHRGFEGSFWAFYPRYFDGFYGFGGNFAWMGLHLWYLEVLFIFSVIALPLFRLLQRERTGTFLKPAVIFFGKGYNILLLSLFLIAAEYFSRLDPGGFGRRDFGGWSVPSYLMIFILGYLMARSPRLTERTGKLWFPSLIIAVLITLSGYILIRMDWLSGRLMIAALRGMNTWCWMLAFLGMGRRLLDHRKSWLPAANEAVLPFYILHQTIIVMTGFLIRNLDWPVAGKFILLATTSLVVISALYYWIVRKWRLMRFLFGMRI